MMCGTTLPAVSLERRHWLPNHSTQWPDAPNQPRISAATTGPGRLLYMESDQQLDLIKCRSKRRSGPLLSLGGPLWLGYVPS